MYEALVLSDQILRGSALCDQFAKSGWFSDVQTAILFTMLSVSKTSYHNNCNAIVMVIDTEFRKRYRGIITEMGAFYGNLAKRTPFYLLFDGNYESSFDIWLNHTKRVFQHIEQPENQGKVVAEIIQLETEVPVTAFMSPMNSY